ncbi:Clp protease N-terminal domain-containing protein [Streptomyces sp. NPDC020800]|uniref:Clp protease N-terminal domain-containing protein n=1 Tax=Streptomyces sp. NPDC020800 TaxID=3365092 RepID=UPI0037A6318B
MTRQPAHDLGGPRPHDAAGLGAELTAVVAGARRRAVRDGDRQIDTAHLLHSLLESDPEVRAVVGDAPQLARLLGYLVQRSIGYGLRWQSTVEDSGAIAVVPDPSVYGGEAKDAGRWSPAAAAAMEDARRRARERDEIRSREREDSRCRERDELRSRERAEALSRERAETRARGTDLLAALVVDPQSRSVEVLARAGISVHELRTRIEAREGEHADGGPAC